MGIVCFKKQILLKNKIKIEKCVDKRLSFC